MSSSNGFQTERKASEAKYRGLLEAAPDGMVVVNQDGRIVLLNARAESQFGYRRDEDVYKRQVSTRAAERVFSLWAPIPACFYISFIGRMVEVDGGKVESDGP